jgi:hypothetical protein
LEDILNDIEEINLARSYHPPPPRQANTPTSPPTAIKSSGSEETFECDRDLTFLSERKAKRNTGRSLIFTNVNFSKQKEGRSGDKLIRVYFFNLPASKLLPYDRGTSVADLTRIAIDAYCQDKQFDSARVKDRMPHSTTLPIKTTSCGYRRRRAVTRRR